MNPLPKEQNRKERGRVMSNINNTPFDAIFQELKAAISELPAKKQGLIADWLLTWTKYLRYERTFIPDMLRRYKRGDIVHLNLGFNIGNEQGGAHYAVVVDVNNNRKSGCVVVVPISSLEAGKGRENVHGSEVYIGKIIPNSDIESYAQPLQIRCISKLRIIKPKTDKDNVYRLSPELMNELDKKIIELFTKRS